MSAHKCYDVLDLDDVWIKDSCPTSQRRLDGFRLGSHGPGCEYSESHHIPARFFPETRYPDNSRILQARLMVVRRSKDSPYRPGAIVLCFLLNPEYGSILLRDERYLETEFEWSEATFGDLELLVRGLPAASIRAFN